ncbi:hypothetical protein Pan216_58150 [Planctomycetes bacterium Pan216]|uniref:(5-formylfuran-3-yl)methyl phosphate synthase n=1 Tax=Kolteria novifilia TaxID=2527975 RepID=A0A518BD65_9BACT|nr:hypothetical protein Pan216_58150 [Planctomycetes bacterium Pan216]
MEVARPRLLVSVRSPAEATAALDGGAEIIDVKEPDRGSLGAADPHVIREILEVVRQQDSRVVSAALGELGELGTPWPTDLRADLDFAKVGLARAHATNWREQLGKLAKRWEFGPRLVPVAYADHERAEAPAPADVLDWAMASSSRLLLLDTFGKDGTSLENWLSLDAVGGLVTTARRAGIAFAVAGSLRADSVRSLANAPADIRPAIIAVRGAACADDDRTNGIDAARVAALRASLEPLPCGNYPPFQQKQA